MDVCEIYTGPNFILARPPYWLVFLVLFPKEARLALVVLSHSQLSLAVHLPALDNSASFKQTWQTGGAKGGTSAQLRGWEGCCGCPPWTPASPARGSAGGATPSTVRGQPAKPQVGRWRQLWRQFGGCSRGCRSQQDAGKPRQPAGKGAVAERRGRRWGMVRQAARGEKQEQISFTLLAEQPASSSAVDAATDGTTSR